MEGKLAILMDDFMKCARVLCVECWGTEVRGVTRVKRSSYDRLSQIRFEGNIEEYRGATLAVEMGIRRYRRGRRKFNIK